MAQNAGHTTKPCKITKCTCVHKFQDEKYGLGMRVHNPNKNGYICTVCRNQKP